MKGRYPTTENSADGRQAPCDRSVRGAIAATVENPYKARSRWQSRTGWQSRAPRWVASRGRWGLADTEPSPGIGQTGRSAPRRESKRSNAMRRRRGHLQRASTRPLPTRWEGSTRRKAASGAQRAAGNEQATQRVASNARLSRNFTIVRGFRFGLSLSICVLSGCDSAVRNVLRPSRASN
mgnify:CR=1 FL=1